MVLARLAIVLTAAVVAALLLLVATRLDNSKQADWEKCAQKVEVRSTVESVCGERPVDVLHRW